VVIVRKQTVIVEGRSNSNVDAYCSCRSKPAASPQKTEARLTSGVNFESASFSRKKGFHPIPIQHTVCRAVWIATAFSRFCGLFKPSPRL
jgi:hypothetical protein